MARLARGAVLSAASHKLPPGPLIPSEVEGLTDDWACPSTSLGMSGVGDLIDVRGCWSRVCTRPLEQPDADCR